MATHVILRAIDTDFDGDGVPDPLVHAGCFQIAGEWTCWSGELVVPGSVPGAETPISQSALGMWVGEPNTDWLADGGAAGDFDGDGYTDLYFASVECDGTTEGSVYLIRGPADRWPKEPTYIGDAADARWVADHASLCFGDEADAGRDLDGDGMDEIITTNSYDPLKAYIFRGRVDPAGTIAVDDEMWFGLDDIGASTLLLPDMDGDGVEELSASVYDYRTGYAALAWATDPLSYPAGTALSSALSYATSASGTSFAFMPQGGLGDWNEDGYEDTLIGLAVPASVRPEARLCAAPLGGGRYEAGDFTGALGPIICHEPPGFDYLGDVDPVADVDGDGRMDLLWRRIDLDWAHGSCLIPSGRLPDSGMVEFQDIAYCFTGGEDDPGFDALADLDGDGLPELVMSASRWEGPSGMQFGRVLVAPGFEIPWDDAAAW